MITLRSGARSAAALLLVGLGVLTPSAAHAGGELGLSYDGVAWHGSLDRPLFDPQLRWVPGDVRSSRFFVSNRAADHGDLTLALARVGQQDLIDTSYLEVAARVDGGSWSTVVSGDYRTLVDSEDVAPGERLAVDVRVALAADAPNSTMHLGNGLVVEVRLGDALVRDHHDSNDSDGFGSLLPNTGSAVTPWLPPFALLLLGSGTYLVLRRRTSRDARSALSQS